MVNRKSKEKRNGVINMGKVQNGCLYCRDGEPIALGDGQLIIKNGTLDFTMPIQEHDAKERSLPAFADLHLRREYVFDNCPFCKMSFPKRN